MLGVRCPQDQCLHVGSPSASGTGFLEKGLLCGLLAFGGGSGCQSGGGGGSFSLSRVGPASSERTSSSALDFSAWGTTTTLASLFQSFWNGTGRPLGPGVLGDSARQESSDLRCRAPLRRKNVLGPQTCCSGSQCAGRSFWAPTGSSRR